MNSKAIWRSTKLSGKSDLEIPELPQKANCYRVSFKTTSYNTKCMQQELISFDYGLRGKSIWILEALNIFLNDDMNPYRNQQIIECAGYHGFDSQHSILIPHDEWVRAWHAGINSAVFGAESNPSDYIDPSVPIVLSAAVNFRIFWNNSLNPQSN